MSDGKDYYKVLDVAPKATEDEIKAAFRSKALQLHPDKNPDDPNAARAFQDITNAYEVLKDSRKRLAYDALQSGDTSSSAKPAYGTPGQGPVHDNFDEWLRKWMREHGYGPDGEKEAKRQRQWKQHSNIWAEKVASWEEEKREAKIQQERDFRRRQKTANARAARQAAVLQKFWQASPGLTWQDGVVLSLMSAFAVTSLWLLWPEFDSKQHQDSSTRTRPDAEPLSASSS